MRVVFKDTDVCVSNCDDPHATHTHSHTHTHTHSQTHSHSGLPKDASEPSEHHPHPHHHQPQHYYHLPKSAKKQLVFQIGHGPAKLPLVSVSKSLGEPELAGGGGGRGSKLKEVYDPEVFSKERSYHGDHPENFFHATPVNDADAYATLVEEVLQGRRQSFVSTNQLLLAWQIWENVLAFSPPAPSPSPSSSAQARLPRIYDAGDPASLLNFVLKVWCVSCVCRGGGRGVGGD